MSRSRELFIPVHVDLPGHIKTGRAARLLGISRAQVVGHVVVLWGWAAVYAPDGDVTKHDDFELAEAAGWPGDPRAFVDALIECGKGEAGFLERTDDGRLLVHELPLYLEPLLSRREHDRERQARRREREKAARIAELAALGSPTPPGGPPRTPAPVAGAIGSDGRQVTPGTGHAAKDAEPVSGVTETARHADVTVTSRGCHGGEESRGEERRVDGDTPPLPPRSGGEPSGSPKSGLRPREAARRAKAEAIGGGRTRRRATDPEAPPWVQDLAGRTRAGQGLTDAEGEALGRWLDGDDVSDPRKGKAA